MLRRLGQQIVGFTDRFSTFLVYFGMGCLMFMMAIGAADAAATKLASQPIPGAHELIEVGMVIVVFWSLAYVQGKGKHIQMTLLSARVPNRVRKVFELAALLISLVFFILIAWSGGVYAWGSWQVREYYAGALTFAVYPVKFGLVLGASTIILRLIVDIIRSFAMPRRSEYVAPQKEA